MQKPPDLFDRTEEWADLTDFLTLAGPGLRVGVVYGRRRQGKSYLLRRLVATAGGLYVMPLEESRTQALARFGAEVAAGVLDLASSGIRFDDWDSALRTTIQGLSARARQRGTPQVLVVDELPYLLAHSPEIPSVLQRLYDQSVDQVDAPAVRVIVCGSALSVMTELLSGTRALRGRAMVDLCLRPFDYREAAAFWGISDLRLALRVHSVFGGTPGYRDLVAVPPPRTVSGLGVWLARTVLNPRHALFSEADYLLREDPRLTDRALYHSVLSAIAAGRSTPSQIGAEVGRAAQSLAYPIGVLQTAGFVTRTDDVLRQRRPLLQLADPIVRFHELVVAPRLAMLEERQAVQAFEAAQHTFDAAILGPHFEQLCRMWTARFGTAEGLRAPVGPVGPAAVSDGGGRSQYEIDVVGLAQGQAVAARNPHVVVIGEAKHTSHRLTVAALARLDHIRALLINRGIDAAAAQLVLFTSAGADTDLARAVASRDDVLLVDLPALYGR